MYNIYTTQVNRGRSMYTCGEEEWMRIDIYYYSYRILIILASHSSEMEHNRAGVKCNKTNCVECNVSSL